MVAQTDNELVRQFADSVRRADFERWLGRWRGRTEERTMESNVVDVTVNFRDGWVLIADVLAADHTVLLPSIEGAIELLDAPTTAEE